MQSFSSVIPKLLMSELKNPSIVLSTSLPRPGPGPGLEPAQGGVEVSVASVSVDDLAGLGLADVGDQADHLARLHRPEVLMFGSYGAGDLDPKALNKLIGNQCLRPLYCTLGTGSCKP